MFAATAVAKGLMGVGWISLAAVDSHIVRIHLTSAIHNDILGALIVVSIGIITHWKRNSGGTGRTYADGVVDGMKLTAAAPSLPTPRRSPGAKILYLSRGTNVDPCTHGAPMATTRRSSS